MYVDQKVIFRKNERMAPKNQSAANARSLCSVGRTDYEASRAWGLSTAVDVYGCDPDAIRSRERIVQFTHELCDLLGVKRFGETQVVRFGDLFSCKWYDAAAAADLARKFFGAEIIRVRTSLSH